MINIQNILDDIQAVREVVTDLSDDNFIIELNELKQKLEENKFYLVVTGLFKRGKSSVINALIGKNIALVAVTPVTAVITFFEYNKTSGCEVIFNDNHRKEISLSEISSYVSEEENPQNTKNVSQIKVYSNKNELLKKCCIVDTPGLGSVFEHNSETTYNYIPKIDAALFILSADIPVSKTDADFLREIHSTVPHIIYVLNKTDLLDKKQLEKLISYNIKVIADITNKDEQNIIVVPVSCKLAGEKGKNGNFDALANTIDRMIEKNKNEIIIETGRNRLNIIAKSILQFLTVKVETIQMPVKMIEEKQATLKKSAEVMYETRHEFDLLVKGQLDKILEKHMAKADELLLEMLKQLKQKITSVFDMVTVINNKTIIGLSHEFSDEIISRLEEIKESAERKIIDEFNQLLVKYQARSETFLNEFVRMLNELFGLSFEILSGQFDLNVYTSFYFLKFADGQSVEPKLPAIYRFLPEKLRRMKCQSILKKNAEILIEVNKGRMKPDIFYKVNESFRRFKAEEEKQVELVYQRINKLLEEGIIKKTKSKNEIEHELKNINRKLEVLKSIA